MFHWFGCSLGSPSSWWIIIGGRLSLLFNTSKVAFSACFDSAKKQQRYSGQECMCIWAGNMRHLCFSLLSHLCGKFTVPHLLYWGIDAFLCRTLQN
jgi:hypothetical protein